MASIELVEAVGSDGKICTVIRRAADVGAGIHTRRWTRGRLAHYRLASGERLYPTSDPKVLETSDGERRFTLAEVNAQG